MSCVSTRVSVNEATIGLSVTSNERVMLSGLGSSGGRTARFFAATKRTIVAMATKTSLIVRWRMLNATRMRRITYMLFPFTIALTLTAAPKRTDWKDVEEAVGRAGSVQPGD